MTVKRPSVQQCHSNDVYNGEIIDRSSINIESRVKVKCDGEKKKLSNKNGEFYTFVKYV